MPPLSPEAYILETLKQIVNFIEAFGAHRIPIEIFEKALEVIPPALLLARRKQEGFVSFLFDLTKLKDSATGTLITKTLSLEVTSSDGETKRIPIALVNQIAAGATFTSKPGSFVVLPSFFELTADAKAAALHIINDELDALFSSNPWWKKTLHPQYEAAGLADCKPALTYGDTAFKVLGYEGPNPAIDNAVLLVDPLRGHVRVLAGKRPTGEICLNGGMVENKDSVLTASSKEMLEELFGGRLCLPGNPSAARIEQLSQDKVIDTVLNVLKTHLKTPDEKTRFDQPEIKKIITIALLHTFQGSELPSRASVLEALTAEQESTGLKNHGWRQLLQTAGCTATAADQNVLDKIDVTVRRDLYLATEEGEQFVTWAKSQARTYPHPLSNDSDARNTDKSYMVTTPILFLFNTLQLDERLEAYGLELSAGDDMVAITRPRLSIFLGDVENVFTSHGWILLSLLHKKLVNPEALKTESGSPCRVPGSEALSTEEARAIQNEMLQGGVLLFSKLGAILEKLKAADFSPEINTQIEDTMRRLSEKNPFTAMDHPFTAMDHPFTAMDRDAAPTIMGPSAASTATDRPAAPAAVTAHADAAPGTLRERTASVRHPTRGPDFMFFPPPETAFPPPGNEAILPQKRPPLHRSMPRP